MNGDVWIALLALACFVILRLVVLPRLGFG